MTDRARPPAVGLRRAFGGTPRAYPESPHWADGAFHNRLPGNVVDPAERRSLLLDAVITRRPAPPQIPVDVPHLPSVAGQCAATWLGHSSVLLEVGGRWVLTDPVFSERVSPSAHLGPRRLHRSPLDVAELPALDAVLISHDHYDHLDAATIAALATTTTTFVVPLGIGAHLRCWGVGSERIVELDWGQRLDLDGLELGCTEARHFSGRSLRRNRTLWASWTIVAGDRRVFFGGDSGYTPAFADLAEEHDGFDLTILPIGAYDPRWSDIHMDPTEAVQTHLDVRGEVMLPIHWGTFTLAFHPWPEPIERAIAEARRRHVRLATPRVGQRFETTAPPDETPDETWWRS